ncbi:hypothetical protein QTI66_18370 [Variovorax sp. J22R133]|uniref:hypothetical protein n=1 Tax=Variovorax brevis TaxID=3053503 RepID=UPI0025754B9C|nr:hypothetical protein [Variovorax sp. J22R133]MDM0114125.1 hypothetical protein [Variovorax sp. J22R133]
MAGWISVLQLVPWSDVISNAPKVAEAAKKLWNTASKKTPPDVLPDTPASPLLSPEAKLADLQARLAATEAAVADLQKQMVASSELITTLAAQNTQLIQRVERNRIRMLWLSAATVALGLLAIIEVSLHLAR